MVKRIAIICFITVSAYVAWSYSSPNFLTGMGTKVEIDASHIGTVVLFDISNSISEKPGTIVSLSRGISA